MRERERSENFATKTQTTEFPTQSHTSIFDKLVQSLIVFYDYIFQKCQKMNKKLQGNNTNVTIHLKAKRE